MQRLFNLDSPHPPLLIAAGVVSALLLLVPVGGLVGAGGFDGLYGQDAYAYADYALGPLRNDLQYFQPFPYFFWPPGYPLLVAALSFLTGPTPRAGQFVSLLAGGLTPVFTLLLARATLNIHWHVSVLAALIVALTPQLWQSSAVVMADTTGLCCATLGIWSLARYHTQPRARWLALASVALAFALLARWIYGLLALLSALSVLRQPRPLSHLLLASLISLLTLSPLVSIFLLPNLPFLGNFQVHHWNFFNAFQNTFYTPDGLLTYTLPNGLYYLIAPAHWAYFTPLIAAFLLPGLFVAWRQRLWLILAWATAIYLYHAGDPYQNFRFTLAYLPPLAILTALGIDRMATVIPARWRWGLRGVVLLGGAAMLIGGLQLTGSFIARKNTELEITRRVIQNVPSDARLLTFNLTSTFRHYTPLETLELYDHTPATLAPLLTEPRPFYLLVDPDNIETQWRAEPLGQTYLWLRETIGLEEIEAYGNYHLYRIK